MSGPRSPSRKLGMSYSSPNPEFDLQVATGSCSGMSQLYEITARTQPVRFDSGCSHLGEGSRKRHSANIPQVSARVSSIRNSILIIHLDAESCDMVFLISSRFLETSRT